MSAPMRIVFLDTDTFPDTTVIREFSFPHEIVRFKRTEIEEVDQRIAGADIVVTNKVPIRLENLKKTDRLRHIAVAATGTDIIDLAACGERGISISNIRNYAVSTVPEHTFALILALRRSLLAYATSVQQGRWQDAAQFCYFDHPIKDLAGSTLGIIGDGVLGRAVADIGRAFGMRTLFASYKGSVGMGPLYTPFEEVLSQSDVITLHLPLLPTTRNLISDAEFEAMVRRPLLINTSRGGLVDEEALARALRHGKIAGAGFDVATVEPPPFDHPLMQLLDLPNFILTPHVAWASEEATQALADQLVDNVEAFWLTQDRI